METKYWALTTFGIGLVVGFTSSLLVRPPRDIVAGGGILATFVIAAVGWCIIYRRMDHEAKQEQTRRQDKNRRWNNQHQLERDRLKADLYTRHKLDMIRTVYTDLTETMREVSAAAGAFSNGRSDRTDILNKALNKVATFAFEIAGIGELLDDPAHNRILNKCLKTLSDTISLLNLEAKQYESMSKKEIDSIFEQVRKKLTSIEVYGAFSCLAGYLKPPIPTVNTGTL